MCTPSASAPSGIQENGRFRWNMDEGFKPLMMYVLSKRNGGAGSGGTIGPSPSYGAQARKVPG